MTVSLLPLWIMEFVTNLLMMALSVYAISTSSKIVKGNPNVSLWLYLHWQIIALGVFAFSHSIGHILKRLLLIGGQEGAWEAISPFSGGINTIAFVIVGILTFLYKDLKMASEKFQQQEEARKIIQEANEKLQESYLKLEEDAGLIARQYDELIEANEDLDEAYRRLKEANDTLTSFFEVIPDGVIMVDRDMVVRNLNSKVANFVPGMKLGRKCYESVPKDSNELCVHCVIKNTFADGQTHEQEAVMTLRGGDRRHIRNLSFPIKDEKGEVVLAVSILRDVTERMELTEKLIRQNEELKVLDQAKSNFIDIASHELRTPLSSIVGYVDLMVDSQKVGDLKDLPAMLESVQRSTGRLREIIDDLLDVAKIESGKITFDKKPLSVKTLFEVVTAELEPLYVHRGHSLQLEYGKQMLEISADPNRMHQVFYNLLNNAIKYTPDGGVITLRAEVVNTMENENLNEKALRSLGPDRPAAMMHVTVSDSGIGIPRGDLDRIFERFFEVGDISQHSSGKAKFMGGGTGLGLSIAKGIIEGHGGRVWAESEGKDEKRCPGSTFHVLLPLSAEVAERAEEMAEAQPPPRRLAPAPEDEERRPMLLLIEDDPDITMFTSRILKSKYDVATARDGMEGIQKAFDVRPDLILLDIWMAGLDGYEVCKVLKSNPALKDILVAFFSASAQKTEIERGYEVGADDYITKPFTARELLERVEKILSAKEGISAA